MRKWIWVRILKAGKSRKVQRILRFFGLTVGLPKTRRLIASASHLQKVLLLGCTNSGTSLLCAMLGAHPQIGMAREDLTLQWLLQEGVPVIGNKLGVPAGISLHRKSHWWGRFLRHFGLFLSWPKSKYSIVQLLDMIPNLKIIYIERRQESNLESMRRWGIGPFHFFWGIYIPHTSRWVRREMARRYQESVLTKELLASMLKGKDRFLRVEFEALTHRNKRIGVMVLTDICGFLGLQYHPLMLEQGPKFNRRYPHAKVMSEKERRSG